MTLLADIAEPVARGGLNTVALWFSGISSLVATIALIKCFTPGDKRREITFAGTPVDKKEFDAHVESNNNAHTQLFSKIGGVERGATALLRDNDADARKSRSEMHQEITEVKESVASLDAKTEMIDRRVLQMDNKIDRLIERKSS